MGVRICVITEKHVDGNFCTTCNTFRNYLYLEQLHLYYAIYLLETSAMLIFSLRGHDL